MTDLTPERLAELRDDASDPHAYISLEGVEILALLGMLAEKETETIDWKRIADQRLTEALEYAENEGVLLDSIKGLESERDAALAEVERLTDMTRQMGEQFAPGACRECLALWPCDTRQLLDVLAEKDAEIERLRESVNREHGEPVDEVYTTDGLTIVMGKIHELRDERDAALAEAERWQLATFEREAAKNAAEGQTRIALADLAALRKRLGAVKKVAERAIRVAKECGEAPDHIAYLRAELSKSDPQ